MRAYQLVRAVAVVTGELRIRRAAAAAAAAAVRNSLMIARNCGRR